MDITDGLKTIEKTGVTVSGMRNRLAKTSVAQFLGVWDA
jgi:hypothetical protein